MIPTKHIHRAQSNPQIISVASQASNKVASNKVASKSQKSKKEIKESSRKRKTKKIAPMQRSKSSNLYEDETINAYEQKVMKHIKNERRSGTSARRYAQRTKSLTSFEKRKKSKHKRSSSKRNPKQTDIKNENSDPCYVIQAHFKNNILAITVYDSSSSNEWRQEFTQNAFKHVQIYKVAKVLIHSIQQTANNNNDNGKEQEEEKKNDTLTKQIKIFEYNNFCYVTLLNSNLPSFALRPNNDKNKRINNNNKNEEDVLQEVDEDDDDDDDDDDDALLSNGSISPQVDSFENMMIPPSLNGMTVTNMIKATSKSRSPSVASRRKKKKRNRHSTGNIEKREKKIKDRTKTKEAKEKELLYTRHLLEDVSSNGSHSHSHHSHSRSSTHGAPSPSPSPSPIPSPSPSPLPFMQHPSYPQYPYITNDDNKNNKNGNKSIKIALNGNYLTNTQNINNQNINQQLNANYMNQIPQIYHIPNNNNHNNHHHNNHDDNVSYPYSCPHPPAHHHFSSHYSPQHTFNNGYGYHHHHHHHHNNNGYNINSVSMNITPKKQKSQKWSNPANFGGYNANNNNYNINNHINSNEFIGGYRKESGDTLYSNTSYISSSPSAGQVNSGITSISYDSMSTLSPTQISHKSQKIIDKGPGFTDNDHNDNDNDNNDNDKNEKSLSSTIIDGDYYKDKEMADKDHIKYDYV